jgi:hypothetical protein
MYSSRAPDGEDVLRVGHSTHRDVLPTGHAPENLLLVVTVGIADEHLEHEPVELRLGQRVGALLLDRVLGGEHQKRLVQHVSLAADRHLLLLHRLQQGGLHLGGRAIDLVGEQDVREQGTAHGPKLAGPLVEDHRADDVGRQQIGRELNPLERGANHLSQRAHREGLGEAGDAFQQDVPTGEEPHEQALDHCLLPHDALAHLLHDRSRDCHVGSLQGA